MWRWRIGALILGVVLVVVAGTSPSIHGSGPSTTVVVSRVHYGGASTPLSSSDAGFPNIQSNVFLDQFQVTGGTSAVPFGTPIAVTEVAAPPLTTNFGGTAEG